MPNARRVGVVDRRHGRGPAGDAQPSAAEIVKEWIMATDFDTALWTALPTNFVEKTALHSRRKPRSATCKGCTVTRSAKPSARIARSRGSARRRGVCRARRFGACRAPRAGSASPPRRRSRGLPGRRPRNPAAADRRAARTRRNLKLYCRFGRRLISATMALSITANRWASGDSVQPPRTRKATCPPRWSSGMTTP